MTLRRYAIDRLGRTWEQMVDPRNYWVLAAGQEVVNGHTNIWTTKLEGLYGPIEYYMEQK